MAEDRQAFRALLDRIGQPYPPSVIVEGETPQGAPGADARGARRDRRAGRDPARVHARRLRWRHRPDRGGVPRARPLRPAREPDRPGHRRALPERLAGGRVRGHARRGRHVHRGLLDGERRPARRAHRRLDRRRAGPDAFRPDPPAPAQRGARHHPRTRRRGRLQRPVRALAGPLRIRRDRGQPARVALVGAGVEGDRLPDRARRGTDRDRPAARRDPATPSPARPSLRSSRRSITSSSSCRASHSTSSPAPSAAWARR